MIFYYRTRIDTERRNVTPAQNAVPALANGYSVSGISISSCRSGNINSYDISETF